ncbi:ATPase MORC2A-like [Neocloeon triangulifer]|uniref:ATPase MORC2A-like n=1 Tax=Neocloeon triangulifer TaxID=2078957 RepID=UPI00286F475A|nr:ATPase MORC2A-like [Neocloeon triangulifer]
MDLSNSVSEAFIEIVSDEFFSTNEDTTEDYLGIFDVSPPPKFTEISSDWSFETDSPGSQYLSKLEAEESVSPDKRQNSDTLMAFEERLMSEPDEELKNDISHLKPKEVASEVKTPDLELKAADFPAEEKSVEKVLSFEIKDPDLEIINVEIIPNKANSGENSEPFEEPKDDLPVHQNKEPSDVKESDHGDDFQEKFEAEEPVEKIKEPEVEKMLILLSAEKAPKQLEETPVPKKPILLKTKAASNSGKVGPCRIPRLNCLLRSSTPYSSGARTAPIERPRTATPRPVQPRLPAVPTLRSLAKTTPPAQVLSTPATPRRNKYSNIKAKVNSKPTSILKVQPESKESKVKRVGWKDKLETSIQDDSLKSAEKVEKELMATLKKKIEELKNEISHPKPQAEVSSEVKTPDLELKAADFGAEEKSVEKVLSFEVQKEAVATAADDRLTLGVTPCHLVFSSEEESSPELKVPTPAEVTKEQEQEEIEDAAESAGVTKVLLGAAAVAGLAAVGYVTVTHWDKLVEKTAPIVKNIADNFTFQF